MEHPSKGRSNPPEISPEIPLLIATGTVGFVLQPRNTDAYTGNLINTLVPSGASPEMELLPIEYVILAFSSL